MNQFRLAENLIRLRHKKGITQEKLADFLGVSKASVSKWETNQSFPDIAQLPKLASFYDVTIDEMMGYEAQLSMKEVKQFYQQFSEKFATCGFDEVHLEVRDFIRVYYACDIALLQMVVLLMNHVMLATPSRVPEVIAEMIELCEHIQEISSDVNIANSATLFEANLNLMLGKPEVAIEKLNYRQDIMNVSDGADMVLVQAYQMAGQMEEATEWNQVSVFKSLLNLVEGSIFYLMNNLSNQELGQTTIDRVQKVIDSYEMKTLHANTYLKFLYVKAMYMASHGRNEEALEALTNYANDAVEFITKDAKLHGDEYFDKLDGYFNKMDDYVVLPRNPQTVLATLAKDLQHPVFAALKGMTEFDDIMQKLKI